MGLSDRDYMRKHPEGDLPPGVGLSAGERASIRLARWLVRNKKTWVGLGILLAAMVILALILPAE